MCYWYHPESKLLFVDFNGNKQLDNGYELLNVDQYDNALEILERHPSICTVHECYFWQDKNSNIFVDDGELDLFDREFIPDYNINISEGFLLEDPEKIFLRFGEDGNLRGSNIYGKFYDENLGPMYATKPTYWMKGT